MPLRDCLDFITHVTCILYSRHKHTGMIEGERCISMCVDPVAAETAVKAGDGATVQLSLGHQLDRKWGLPYVTCHGMRDTLRLFFLLPSSTLRFLLLDLHCFISISCCASCAERTTSPHKARQHDQSVPLTSAGHWCRHRLQLEGIVAKTTIDGEFVYSGGPFGGTQVAMVRQPALLASTQILAQSQLHTCMHITLTGAFGYNP